MGRNKGRQCGGYGSKLERFALQRYLQREVSKVVTQRHKERQAHWRLDQRRREAEARDALSAVKRRVRVDVVKALMTARLKDDQIEQIKLRRMESIATELQRTAAIEPCASLQERCLYEIAKSFELYTATCPFTREFFASFEPWMITRLSELTVAFKTMVDDNVELLLLQQTEELTLGFVRHEALLSLLVEEAVETKHQFTWQRSGQLLNSGYELVDSWDELDVDEVDIVPTQDETQLRSLKLISCRGLSLNFFRKLCDQHPHLEHLEITDCFDVADSAQGTALLQQLSRWRGLKTLRLSWCSWLTTECLVAFAYHLLDPPASGLVSLEASHYFDVVEDYVRSVFAETVPHVTLKLG